MRRPLCLHIIIYMSSSKKGNKSSPFVVFDIGSAGVGAALVMFDEIDNKINILYETRVFIAFQKSFDNEHLLDATVSAIKRAGENIQKNGLNKLTDNRIKIKNIKRVFCIFKSPWYKIQIKTVRFKEEKPFTVSSKFISKILDGGDKDFLEPNAKLVEKQIIQMLLNGYSTNDPYGKKTTTVDSTLFKSSVPSNVQNKIENVLEAIFTSSDVIFHTFALTSFSIARDMFKAENNFLLIDIDGEVTDIMLVRNEAIKKIASFNLGKNFLIRKVASSLKTVVEEAHSLIRLFFEGKGKKSESLKMEGILDEAREEWLSHFRKILSEFSDGMSLPRIVFLTVDTDMSKWFIDTIRNDAFSSYTLAEEPFTVVEISSRILNKYCTAPTESRSGCDTLLALDAMFVCKIAKG